MRYGFLVSLFSLTLTFSAQGAILDPSAYEASHFLPPPPNAAVTKIELDELKAIAARTGAARLAAAAHDSKDETPDMYNAAVGFDITALPQTNKLLTMVGDEEEADTKAAKAYFHRLRPYAVDKSIRTCTPVKPNKAANSYPSGHSTRAFSMGLVLASLLPNKSQAILARASEYAENRLVCGVHFRSDIVAGQQFGTLLALKLMENSAFQQQMAAAQAELKGR
jgi:acid phosphatase (class A)